jgi:hypothetical protein
MKIKFVADMVKTIASYSLFTDFKQSNDKISVEHEPSSIVK